MLQLFGLPLPDTAAPVARDVTHALAGRMLAAGKALQAGAPAAMAASVRQDARRYLDARRQGQLRLEPGSARTCDENARALLRLTVDAPATRRPAELLVA